MYGAHTSVYRSILDLAIKVKCQCTTIILATMIRPPIADDLCKVSATRHPPFWRSRFLKVFTIYGHGGHLGQWTATSLAIFHSPAPGRLKIKFEQHWSRGSRGEVIRNSTFFPINMHREANLTSPNKGQMSMYNHYFSYFGKPPVPIYICKDSATRHPRLLRR